MASVRGAGKVGAFGPPMSIGLSLLVAALLVALNGFFVAAEFALVKVRATRIAELAREGSGAARLAEHELHHLDVYLSASQFGISLASIALGYVAEPAVARLIDPLLHLLHVPENLRHPVAVVVAIASFTAIHITIGEQAPKYWAIQRPERVSLLCAYPLHWFYLTFKA